MHIDRKPSNVMMVIEHIYHPIAQKFGISLLLRNEINTDIELPPRFFINLTQITGNLVANAIKYASPNGLVNVVFAMDTDEDQSSLHMTVTDTGKTISPDLVSAFNQGKQVANFMGTDAGDFNTRLEYVRRLVSEENGRIIAMSGKDSGTTFSLSIPLQDNYVTLSNGYHTISKNGAVLHN